MTTVRRRKDSTGRVLKNGERVKDGGYEYRWTDRFGKRHSLFAPTLNELRDKENELLLQDEQSITNDVRKMTLNSLYLQWRQTKKGIKQNTFQSYQYMYETYVMSSFGNIKLLDMKKSDVKRFYNDLYDSGLRPGTLDSIHCVVHQVLETAIDDDIIRYNPSDKALREIMLEHASDTRKVKALSVEEEMIFARYLYSHPEERKWYPLFITMMMAGLRLGEVTALQWSDIDFENGMINIDKTLVYYENLSDHKCRYTMNTTKTPAGKRQVVMISIVKDALIMQKDYIRKNGIVCQSNIDGYNDFVFLNRYNCCHNHTSLNKTLERIVRDCNREIMLTSNTDDPLLLPRIHCHMLRHTYGTRLNDAGVNVKAMQAMMGHKDIDTTMRIYVDASENLITQSSDDYEKLINSMLPDDIPR